MKRLIAAYLLGMLTVVGLAYHSGPDAIVQVGMKFAAVQTNYDWHAVPKEAVAVSYDTGDVLAYTTENVPLVKPKTKARK
jgi:hypothetical protein